MTATTKKQYTQGWTFCISIARHAWRFFLLNPDATIDNMSDPSRDAWIACYVVWADLNDTEQAIIRAHHTTNGSQTDVDDAVAATANRLGLNDEDARRILRKAWREWAIKRGLADR